MSDGDKTFSHSLVLVLNTLYMYRGSLHKQAYTPLYRKLQIMPKSGLAGPKSFRGPPCS